MLSCFSKTVCAVAIALVSVSSTAQSSEGGLDLGTSMKAIQANMPDGESLEFARMIAESDLPARVYGSLMFAKGHFDKAAWFYNADAQAHDDAFYESRSNLAYLLTELNADAPDLYPDFLVENALDISRDNIANQPENPAFHSVLASALDALADIRDDEPELRNEALAAAMRAAELAGDDPAFWMELAYYRAKYGDKDGAAAAMAKAAEYGPSKKIYGYIAENMGIPVPARDAAPIQCKVDFRCKEICPKSIIGQIDLVTCEMENANQLRNCTDGLPYATAYNCDESFPVYGILIPGLNSGASLCIPGFCVHLLIQGDGRVDVRVEGGPSFGPLTAFVGADGHYQPKKGFSVNQFNSGVRWSIIRSSPAAKLATDLGQTPLHFEIETKDNPEGKANLELYGIGLLH